MSEATVMKSEGTIVLKTKNRPLDPNCIYAKEEEKQPQSDGSVDIGNLSESKIGAINSFSSCTN